MHAWLRRRRTSQPQAQVSEVKSTSPASNIEVIALEEDSDEDEKQVNVGVKQDYKKLYEEKCEELMVQNENLKNYENIMIDVEKCVKDSAGEVDKKNNEIAKLRKLFDEEKESKEKEISMLKEKIKEEEEKSKSLSVSAGMKVKLEKQVKEESLANTKKIKQLEKDVKAAEETNKKFANQLKEQSIAKEKEKQKEESSL